jgi:hypothetical protein
VRTLPVAFAISAASHIVVLTWLGMRTQVAVGTGEPRPRSSPSRSTASPTPAANEPIAITIYNGPSREGSSVSRGRTRVSTDRGHPRGGGNESPVPTGPAHSPLMAMRGSSDGSAPRPELGRGLSDRFFDDYVENSQPAPSEPAPTGELEPSGHGTYRSKHEAFDAQVNRDGTVRLHDTPDVGDFHIPWAQIGSVRVPLPMIIGRMSFDDALMRRYGIDPYAAEKLRWLDKTRDERARIGLANRKYDLAHSTQFMQANLEWLWKKTADPAERKQALFELWDEVAETGDDDLVRGGAAARTYLIGFVRAHLPAGSPGAFTTPELDRLNAHRTSRERFAPYDESGSQPQGASEPHFDSEVLPAGRRPPPSGESD